MDVVFAGIYFVVGGPSAVFMNHKGFLFTNLNWLLDFSLYTNYVWVHMTKVGYCGYIDIDNFYHKWYDYNNTISKSMAVLTCK